jgi:hypothetical protein
MSAEQQNNPGQPWPREVTPEEAAKLRAHYLALAREAELSTNEKTNRDQNRDDSESTDATVAAFILPGD